VHRPTQQFDEWRASEHRVQRAWEVWLTAERSDQALAYAAFVGALAEEEHAAAQVERTVRRNPPARSAPAPLASG
jgi:hypothetical protein